jgi:putative DNA primase/helicase
MALDKPKLERTVATIGDSLITTYHCKTFNDTKEIRYYSDKDCVYKDSGEQVIEQTIRQQVDREISRHDMAEILYYIRTSTYVDRQDFDANPDIRNLKNGLFNISTGKLEPHKPDYLSLIQLPVKYDKKATCRPIIEALYNTFEDTTDIPLFLEWIAYNLFWKNKDLQKEMLTVGPPECGKSVLLNIIIALLGSQNVSAVTFQQLSSNRFALAQLFGKIANIYADITHTRVEDIERFKAIATADEVEAEKKGMQLFKFRPEAKQTYSCNIPPRAPLNVDDSFYRRWILIKCAWRETDYFTGKPRVKDRDILAKLATEENLSGLLNLIIISARRLIKRKRFCKEPPTDIIREEYERMANPVKLWIESSCVEDSESELEIDAGYRNYVEFCKARRITPLKKEWVGKELGNLGYVSEQRGTGKNRKRVWIGLSVKDTRNGICNGTSIEILTGVQGSLRVSNSKEVSG